MEVAMRLEMPLPRIGELRIEDLRRVLGDEVWKVGGVDVCVLAAGAGLPSVQRVVLGWKRSGRGEHRAVVCPNCRQPKEILYADGAGALACSICSKRRTREQREGCLAVWKLGGREEDRLLRLLERDRLTSAGLDRARVLADEIKRGDLDRLRALRSKIKAAFAMTEARPR
jgi:hypothetical protein